MEVKTIPSVQYAPSLSTVAVIGAGLLGKCVAIDLSLCNVNVILIDKDESKLKSVNRRAYETLQPLYRLGYIEETSVKSNMSRIKLSLSLQDCEKADMVIEAIPEDIVLKRDLVKQLAGICHEDTILATSTMNLPINDLFNGIKNPRRTIGLRFLHPCVRIPVAVVTVGTATSTATENSVESFLESVGKDKMEGPSKYVLNRQTVLKYQAHPIRPSLRNELNK